MTSQYYLKRVTGKHEHSWIFELTPGRFAIGRNKDAPIDCQSDFCSRKHGTLYVTEDSVSIEDHGSYNGIYVDDSQERILKVTELFPDSYIGIGCQVTDSTINEPNLYIFTLAKRKALKVDGDGVVILTDDEDDVIERRRLPRIKEEEIVCLSDDEDIVNHITPPPVIPEKEKDIYEEKNNNVSMHAKISLQRASVDTIIFKLPERVADGRITTKFPDPDSDSDDEDDLWLQQSQIHHQLKREEDEVCHENLPDEYLTFEPFIIDLDSDGELENNTNYQHLKSIESHSKIRVRPIKIEIKEEPDLSEGESENDAFFEEEIPSDRMQPVLVWRQTEDFIPFKPPQEIIAPMILEQTHLEKSISIEMMESAGSRPEDVRALQPLQESIVPMMFEQTQTVENNLMEMMESDDEAEVKYAIEENNSFENIAVLVDTEDLKNFIVNNPVAQQQQPNLSPPASSIPLHPNSPVDSPPVLNTPSPSKSSSRSPPHLQSSLPSPTERNLAKAKEAYSKMEGKAPKIELPTRKKEKKLSSLVIEKVKTICDPDVDGDLEKDEREEYKKRKEKRERYKKEKDKRKKDEREKDKKEKERREKDKREKERKEKDKRQKEEREKDKMEKDKKEKDKKGKENGEKDKKAAKISERRQSNPNKVFKRRLSFIHSHDSDIENQTETPIKRHRMRKVSSSDDNDDDFVSKPDPVAKLSEPNPVAKPSEPTVAFTLKAPVARKKPEVIEAPYMPKRRGRAKSVVLDNTSDKPGVDKKQLLEERKKKLKEQACAAKQNAVKPKDTDRKAPAVCKISTSRGEFLMCESVPKVMAPKRASNKLSFRHLEQFPLNGASNDHRVSRQVLPLQSALKNQSENSNPNANSRMKKVVKFNTRVGIWVFEKLRENEEAQIYPNRPLLYEEYEKATVEMDPVTGAISEHTEEQEDSTDTTHHQLTQHISCEPVTQPTAPPTAPPTASPTAPPTATPTATPTAQIVFNDDNHNDSLHAEKNTKLKIDNLLNQMLQWNCEWLDDKEDQLLAAGNEELFAMKHHYVSYKSYISVVTRLMIIEMWTSIHRSFHDKKNARIAYAKIFDKTDRKFETHERTTFHCRLEAAKLRINKPSGYFVLIENETETGAPHTDFGYLATYKKYEDGQLMFDLSIQVAKSEKSEMIARNPNRKLKINFIALIRSDLKGFEGVFLAEYSPLAKYIVNPLSIEPPEKNERTLLAEPVVKNDMNRKQTQAIMEMYHQCSTKKPTIMLLEGPPGSGKSIVIANLIEQLRQGPDTKERNLKILICAQSNGATDNITSKLMKKQQQCSKLNIVRFGIDEKINHEARAMSLRSLAIAKHDSIMRQNSKTASLLDQKKTLEHNIDRLRKLKNISMASEQHDQMCEYEQQLHALQEQTKNLNMHTDKKVEKYGSAIIQNANIVCCTLSFASNLKTYVNEFDICIIDEATQCTEAASLIPLQFKVNHLILIGDTKQLPATVLSRIARKNLLNRSLFTRIQETFEQKHRTIVKQLDLQYRMHPEICKFPSMFFYQNRLRTDASTSAHDFKLKPYTVFSLECCQTSTQTIGNVYNINERNFVVTLLTQMMKIVDPKKYTYGIITPYDRHREEIQNQLLTQGITNVRVNTIDSFQGHEEDVIIISTAKTQGIGFLYDPNRLNVALTRAKHCLVVCGNFEELMGVKMWKSFLDDATKRGVIYHVDEDVENPIDKLMKY